jgi:hypothetical protein
VQQHPFASACHGAQHRVGYVERRREVGVQADGRGAAHCPRFGCDALRAVPRQDEQTPLGATVLEREHQDFVDQLLEDGLLGHALDHPSDRREIQRLLHRRVARARGVRHRSPPPKPTTGRVKPVLDR